MDYGNWKKELYNKYDIISINDAINAYTDIKNKHMDNDGYLGYYEEIETLKKYRYFLKNKITDPEEFDNIYDFINFNLGENKKILRRTEIGFKVLIDFISRKIKIDDYKDREFFIDDILNHKFYDYDKGMSIFIDNILKNYSYMDVIRFIKKITFPKNHPDIEKVELY
ncbi:MAG: hypothetical protein ACOC1K_00100 [Nanoarchaeota archaeon]